METILRIEEHSEKVGRHSRAGYRVITDQQEVVLLIDDQDQCCEQWGYFWSEDDTQSFIGAKLLDVRLTDTALSERRLAEEDVSDCATHEGAIMFVTLDTDRGPLQFVAYNEHNGYYGHEAFVRSRQLTHETVL